MEIPIKLNVKINLDSKDIDEGIKKALVLQERLKEVGECKEDLALLLGNEIKKIASQEVSKIIKNDKLMNKMIKSHFEVGKTKEE